jgi:iron complex outermembrane receptor protein
MTDRTPLFRLAPLLAFGLLSPALQADEGLYLSEQDFLVDIPEITSATRLTQKLTEAPASISIIDRQTIAASGARNIPDLLRLVPGFQSYHVSANKFATSYHGASDDFPRRLEVMVDGRSVYLPLLATVDWTSLGINLQDIERIEVVRGSNVPTQGSNAFMGSINIITRSPALLSGGYVSATAGSMDTRDLQFGHADRLNSWNYRLSGGHEENDGTDLYGDALKRNYLSFSGSYTPTLTDTLWIQAGVDRGHTYVGGADKFEPFSKREHDANYQSIKYQHLYSDTGTVQLTAYHNYLDLETPAMSFERVADYIGTQNPAIVNGFIALNSPREDSEHGTTHSYDTELQLTDRIGSLELVGGLGYRYETAESDVLLQSGKVTEKRWRLFSNLDWDFAPRWSLSSGFMYEDSSENSDALSYRHALIHRPDEQSSIRLGYSISERLPSLLERNGNNTIYAPAGVFGPDPVVYDLDKAANPDLGPERIKTYEIGYYRAFSDQQGHIDLRLFHERLTNVISTYYLPADELAPPPFPMTQGRVSTSMNNFGWENQGVEIQLQRQLGSQLSALLNYTYTNTRTDRWETNKDLMGEAMIFRDAITPEHTASIMLNWTPTSDLNLSLMHYYMDSVHWFEGGVRDSYQRTDLRAAHNWQLSGGTELEAAVTIQNAFGPTYEEFYQYNLFDRRAWLQLTLRYH